MSQFDFDNYLDREVQRFNAQFRDDEEDYDECYYCDRKRSNKVPGFTAVVDTDIGDPEVGPDPRFDKVWVCGLCNSSKQLKRVDLTDAEIEVGEVC